MTSSTPSQPTQPAKVDPANQPGPNLVRRYPPDSPPPSNPWSSDDVDPDNPPASPRPL